MSPKFWKHKRHTDQRKGVDSPRNSLDVPPPALQPFQKRHTQHKGGEAPRNSLDVPPATLQPRVVAGENANVGHSSSPHASLKKDTNEKEMTPKHVAMPNGNTAPSVVARLMGIEALPSQKKQSTKLANNAFLDSRSTIRDLQHNGSIESPKERSHPEANCSDSRKAKHKSKADIPQPPRRVHPQEEQLQRFKIEFMAWQTNRMWEHTKNNNNDGSSGGISPLRMGEKRLGSRQLERLEGIRTLGQKGVHQSFLGKKLNALTGGKNARHEVNSHCDVARNGFIHPRSGTVTGDKYRPRNTGKISVTEAVNGQGRSPPPLSNNTVTLKPISESNSDCRGTCAGTTEDVKLQATVGDIMEEVKDSIRMDIQETKHEISRLTNMPDSVSMGTTMIRSQKESPSLEGAVEEGKPNISNDSGTELRAPRTTGCYASKPESNAVVCTGKKKFLIEGYPGRYRNRADNAVSPCTLREARSISGNMVQEEKMNSFKSTRNTVEKENCPLEVDNEDGSPAFEESLPSKFEQQSHSSEGSASKEPSLEGEQKQDSLCTQTNCGGLRNDSCDLGTSSGNSIISESEASVLRPNSTIGNELYAERECAVQQASTCQLDSMETVDTIPSVVIDLGVEDMKFLDEPQGLTLTSNDCTQTNCGGLRNDSCDPGTSSGNSIVVESEASVLRPNSTLENELYAERECAVQQASTCQLDSMETVGTIPSVVIDLGVEDMKFLDEPQDLTLTSNDCTHDVTEQSKLNPLSPPEVTLAEEVMLSHFDQNCPIILACCSKSSSPATAQTPRSNEQDEDLEAEVHSNEEEYIREVLRTAGLYERWSSGMTFLRWEILTKPMPSWVFEEVEKMYLKYDPNGKIDSKLSISGTVISHRMLFDLLNEALTYVVKPPNTISALRRFISTATVPHGRDLLNAVWHEILNLSCSLGQSCSPESMVVQDVAKHMFMIMAQEEMDGVGEELESIILDELLDEYVSDLYCSSLELLGP